MAEKDDGEKYFGEALDLKEPNPHQRKSTNSFKPPKIEEALNKQKISLPPPKWSLWKPTGTYSLFQDEDNIKTLGDKRDARRLSEVHGVDTGVEFSNYFGIGISLYFKGLKYLMVVFGVLSILSIPALALYLSGGALDDSNQSASLLSKTTMANMPNLDLLNSTSTETKIWGIPQSDMFVVLSWIDVAGAIFYTIAIWYLIYFQHREVDTLDVIQTTMSDYTLWVQRLPNRNGSYQHKQAELKEYFENLAKKRLNMLLEKGRLKEEDKFSCEVANVHIHVSSAQYIQLETELGIYRLQEEHLAFYMLMLQNEKDELENYFETTTPKCGCYNPLKKLRYHWIVFRLKMVHRKWERVVKKLKSIWARRDKEKKRFFSKGNPIVRRFSGSIGNMWKSGSTADLNDVEIGSAGSGGAQNEMTMEEESFSPQPQSSPRGDFPPVCAFVTFNDDRATNALDEYFNTAPRTWMKRIGRIGQCYPEPNPDDEFDETPQPPRTCLWDPDALFYGHKIFVTRAPEPEDIKWEDLEVTMFEKFERYLGTIFVTAIVLGVTFILVYLLEYLDNNLSLATESCAEKAAYVGFEYTAFNTSEQLDCWCSYQDYYDIYDKDYCESYVNDYIGYTLFGFLFVVVIEALNLALEFFLEQSSEKEPHKQRSYGESFLVLKVSLAQICNTALVIIFLYAMTDQDIYGDFRAPWYYDVGVVLLTTMMFNIFIPQMEPFFLRLIRPFNIWFKKKRCMTQDSLNKLYRRPDFVLTARNSLILTTLYICLSFSPGLPLLNFMAFATFFVMYWIDKYNLLRFYDKPMNFDHRQAETTVYAMQFAIIPHLIIAIYQWGYFNITFSEVIGAAKYYEDLGIARSSTKATWNLTTILVIISAILFFKFINSALGFQKILEPLQKKVFSCKVCDFSLKCEEKNPLFEEFIKKIKEGNMKGAESTENTNQEEPDDKDRKESHIIPSYEILDNPMYKKRFGITENRERYFNKSSKQVA
mmetsp:Transcript_10996/g.13807  ORF Transcript_10996/g.13807 Transcript_10996/m.13807 type:complete len:987 (-) Transcript_10996:92-3052(-)